MIYLDNAATTRILDSALTVACDVYNKAYANPSSLHIEGVYAERRIKNARGIIAKTIGASDGEVYFTSGATESNNIAILGALDANRHNGKTVLVNPTEHPSVLNVVKRASDLGYNVQLLKLDNFGKIDLADFESRINGDVNLVSCMLVNNETGIINPVSKMASILKRKRPSAIFHCDAVQGYLKVPFTVSSLGVDLLSASAHKFHGPKGVGFLYIKNKTKVSPLVLGGGQEKGLRSGTENTPGIAAMATAAEEMYNNLKINNDNCKKLKEILLIGIKNNIKDTKVNSTDEDFPYILNVSFPGLRSEVLLHTLEQNGIMVSSGSACASNSKKKTGALIAMGKDAIIIDSAIRFSFSHFNTEDEIKKVIEVLTESVNNLRKTMGRK